MACILAGADINKNDGIYTAYFLQYKNDGVQNMQVRATSDDSTVILTGGAVGAYPIGAVLNGKYLLTPFRTVLYIRPMVKT